MNKPTQSLAGRIGYIELTPLLISEVQNTKLVFTRGGFPRSYLASSDAKSLKWRTMFVKTFLERDLAALGINATPELMRRLWMMLAHYHGNILSYSEIANSLQLSDSAVRKYVDILSYCFMIRLLQPWHEDIGKRQVKMPKLYIRDCGLLHVLLMVQDNMILNHPKLGAAWEGFALEQIISTYEYGAFYFWATHNQAEMDLVVICNGHSAGYDLRCG